MLCRNSLIDLLVNRMYCMYFLCTYQRVFVCISCVYVCMSEFRLLNLIMILINTANKVILIQVGQTILQKTSI